MVEEIGIENEERVRNEVNRLRWPEGDDPNDLL